MNTDQMSITVTRAIDVPAKEIFDLLSLPARHHEFDGSGMVRNADDTERITKVGEQFVMNMNAESQGGDYRRRNLVTAFDQGKMIGWKPGPEDSQEPGGWEYLYQLKSTGSDSTEVTLTYDWSGTDPAILKKVHFPVVSEDQLEESLNLLAAAVTKP